MTRKLIAVFGNRLLFDDGRRYVLPEGVTQLVSAGAEITRVVASEEGKGTFTSLLQFGMSAWEATRGVAAGVKEFRDPLLASVDIPGKILCFDDGTQLHFDERIEISYAEGELSLNTGVYSVSVARGVELTYALMWLGKMDAWLNCGSINAGHDYVTAETKPVGESSDATEDDSDKIKSRIAQEPMPTQEAVDAIPDDGEKINFREFL